MTYFQSLKLSRSQIAIYFLISPFSKLRNKIFSFIKQNYKFNSIKYKKGVSKLKINFSKPSFYAGYRVKIQLRKHNCDVV